MEEVEKIREGLYIKKSLGEYNIVYPIKNEDGSINYKNLLIGGSWKSFIETLIILLLVFFSVYSYMNDTKECFKVLENPCEYCNEVIHTQYDFNSYQKEETSLQVVPQNLQTRV